MKTISSFIPDGIPPIGPPSVVTILNSLEPQLNEVEFVDKGTSVASALKSHDLTSYPTLVLLNAEPLLEADWGYELQDGDIVTLAREPGLWPAVVMWGMMIVTAISTAYSLYTILTLDVPDPSDRGESTNYNITYRGNRVKPNQVMPILYGTFRTFPDYSGQYSLYRDNEQWLYQMFEVTVGTTDPIVADDIRYDSTPLLSFEEYEFEWLSPGESSTIFPSNVIVSDEVSNIELITMDQWTPAYAASPPGVDVTEIIVDITAPQGTFKVSDKGSYNFHSSAYEVEISGPQTYNHFHTMSFSRGRAQRKSKSYRVPAGEYTVRVRRNISGKSNKTDISNDLFWEALRAIEPDVITTNTTRIAVAIRASNQIGNKALSQFNVLAKRHLPVWNGSSWVEQQTNLAAWAYADAVRNVEYGGGHADKYLDTDALETVAAGGAEFNGVFDTDGTIWDALQEICRPMIARPTQKAGGVYSVAEDLPDQEPVAFYNMRSIVVDSFSIQHSLPVSETVNYVQVSFFDRTQDYRETVIDCVPYGVTPNKAKEMRIRGITDEDVAYEYGLRVANESLWRRKRISFTTTLEGFIPGFMTTILVGHYMLGIEESVTSFSGEVRSNSGNTLTVFEDLSEIAGQGGLMCYLMDTDGSPWGPVSCSVGTNTISLGSSPPGGILVYSDSHQGPKFIVGNGSDFAQPYKVLRTQQSGEHQVAIEAVIDSPNAYIGDAQPNTPPLGPEPDDAPRVWGLTAELYGSDMDFNVRLQWETENCDYHLVDMSLDGGTTYEEMGRPREPRIEFAVPYQDNIWIRVRGVGLFVGTAIFAVVNVITGIITYPGIFNLRPAYPFNGNRCGVEWDALQPPTKARVKFKCNGQIIYQINVNHNITTAEVTRQQIMAEQAQNVQGTLFPAPGCRTVTVEMVGISRTSDTTWAEDPVVQTLVMTNDPMKDLLDVTFREVYTGVSFSWTWPETPAGGAYIHMALSPDFVPTLANLVEFTDSNNVTITVDIASETNYYFKLAGFDSFGPDSLEYQEVAITTDPPPEFEMPLIEDEHLHETLSERIDLIDLTPPGGLRGEVTGINAEMADPATGTTAMATTVTQNFAMVNDPDTGTIATATQLDGVQAELDDPATGSSTLAVAVTKHEVDIYDPTDGLPSTAQLTQQTYTQVNASETGLPDTYAAVETQATSIDGLEAQYTVKVESNGLVAGYGLAIHPNDSGQLVSDFLIQVDRFGIYTFDGSDHLAFAVEGGLVKMDGARITDASILNAHIHSFIQSGNYDPGSGLGWKIDKQGDAVFGHVEIYDRNGQIVMSTASSTPQFGSAIDNAAQTWAEVSDIPNHLENAALLAAPAGAYGNIWFDHDVPTSGQVTINGNTLYTSDSRKHVVTPGRIMETHLRGGVYRTAMFIFYTKDGTTTIFTDNGGWSMGANTTVDFFPCIYNDSAETFYAIDGAGTEHQFTPNKHTPICATCSRPDGGTSGLWSFNSLIGTNLALPSDSATMTGADNILVDGDFEYLRDNNLSIDDAPMWARSGNVSAQYVETGTTIYMIGSGQLYQAVDAEVVAGEHLYFSVAVQIDQGANNAFAVSCDFSQGDGGGSSYISPIWLSAGSQPTGMQFVTGVVDVPSDARFMRVVLDNRSTNTNAYVQHVFCTRAPVAITYEVAPTYIKDLAVDTLQIADNAVTLTVYDTCGSVTAPNNIFTHCMTINITHSTASTPLLISWFVENDSWTSNIHYLRIRRNASTVIFQTRTYNNSGGGTQIINGGFSGSIVDAAHGGGNDDYHLDIAGNGGASFSIDQGTLTGLEVKK